MISIIVPLYNKEAYIKKTLASVLGQSFRDFELIVVNDGSTDSSAIIVNDINDSRLKVINIEHAGVSEARNKGIATAKFSWISFLDSDDWWEPNFLDEITKAIQKFPKHQLFATGRTRVFKDYKERYHHSFLPEDGATKEVNYYTVIERFLPPINASNAVFHKSVFEERGVFNASLSQHEDHDLWVRLAIGKAVVFINKPLSFYNKNTLASQSSHTYSANNFKTYLNTLLAVRVKITLEEQRSLDIYFQRFAVLSYIKNVKSYNVEERKTLINLISRNVRGKYAFLLKWMQLFPWFNYYKILKALKN